MLSVVQYWHQKERPEIIRARQCRWSAEFPQEYEVFDRGSASDFISRHFGAEALAGFQACGVPAMASDYFRYHRLAAKAGLYVDSAFLPGVPAQIAKQTNHPVFVLSVPQADLTPDIVRTREVLGKVLLNGVLRTKGSPCPWFSLLSGFVRRLVRERASERIPMVTGIGALTVFDHAVACAQGDPATVLGRIRLALPDGEDLFLAVCRDFLCDHGPDLRKLSPCISTSAEEMEPLFHRPSADAVRFENRAHWSNHQGSIYADQPGTDEA